MSNEILYFGAVLIGLFDLSCADAMTCIIYQDSSWKHNYIQRAKVLTD